MKKRNQIMLSYTGLVPANQSRRLKTIEIEFLKIAEFILEHNYSNIIFKDGICKAINFLAAYCLVLDFDGNHDIEDIKKLFSKINNSLIITSKSNQKNRKVNFDGSLSEKEIKPADYFHVIIKLPTPITDLATYKKVMTNLINKYGSDPSCKDGGRFYYGHPNQSYWYSS